MEVIKNKRVCAVNKGLSAFKICMRTAMKLSSQDCDAKSTESIIDDEDDLLTLIALFEVTINAFEGKLMDGHGFLL